MCPHAAQLKTSIFDKTGNTVCLYYKAAFFSFSILSHTLVVSVTALDYGDKYKLITLNEIKR